MSRRSSGISQAGQRNLKLMGVIVLVVIISLIAMFGGYFSGKVADKIWPVIIIGLLLIEWLTAARPFAREYIYFEGVNSTFADRWIPFYNEVSFGGIFREDAQGMIGFVAKILAMIPVIVAILSIIFGYMFNGITADIFGNHFAYKLASNAFSIVVIYCIPAFYILSFIVYFLAFRQIKIAYDDTVGAVAESVSSRVGNGGMNGKGAGRKGLKTAFTVFPVVQWVILFIPGLRTWPIYDECVRVQTLNSLGIVNTEDSIDKYRRNVQLED